MKRMHVHVAVDDLQRSIGFYSSLFAAEPSDTKPDYAKWMLDDPRVNFAISTRRQPQGVNHLGFQVDTDDELRSMRAPLETADARLIAEKGQACCYARSDKYWVTDPRGIGWRPSVRSEVFPCTATTRRSLTMGLRSCQLNASAVSQPEKPS